MGIKKRFAIIGAAGYIAPRHMAAIEAVDGELVAALDTNDSVGILDKYAPGCAFFTREHQFMEYLQRGQAPIDYLVICIPNYLHLKYIDLGMYALGCNVICEKPLTLSPSDVRYIRTLEDKHGKTVHPIMQMRYNPEVIQLKKEIEGYQDFKFSGALQYYTPRGPWYGVSWKGSPHKSGGILFNIGIHLFDILIFLFGPPSDYEITRISANQFKGALVWDDHHHSQIHINLSIDPDDLPEEFNDYTPHRVLSLTMKHQNGVRIVNKDLSNRFTQLHKWSYEKILAGNGLDTWDALPSIELVHALNEGSGLSFTPSDKIDSLHT
jgi:UDP-N-acetyl-2-amino-2-deoxyglucuronate dehydrogenase